MEYQESEDYEVYINSAMERINKNEELKWNLN